MAIVSRIRTSRTTMTSHNACGRPELRRRSVVGIPAQRNGQRGAASRLAACNAVLRSLLKGGYGESARRPWITSPSVGGSRMGPVRTARHPAPAGPEDGAAAGEGRHRAGVDCRGADRAWGADTHITVVRVLARA